MGVPRRRHCSSRRDRARTHKKLHATALVACSNCGEKTPPHRVCTSCGYYAKRSITVTVNE